jgi:hypothetical protein
MQESFLRSFIGRGAFERKELATRQLSDQEKNPCPAESAEVRG